MSSVSSTTDTPKQCRIAEILQYACDEEVNDNGSPQYHCWPISRMFRICQGRPAVEITRFVDIDINTGEVSLPRETSQFLPKGKPWRDVRTYERQPPQEG